MTNNYISLVSLKLKAAWEGSTPGVKSWEDGALSKSQFPVFALFARKMCARAAGRCARPWSFEVVRGHELRTYVRHRRRVGSRRECMELCLQEREFACRLTGSEKSLVFQKATEMVTETVRSSSKRVQNWAKVVPYVKLEGGQRHNGSRMGANTPIIGACGRVRDALGAAAPAART
ncbi:Uncharacterized protein GBIM_00993 [Gryllus bimaculatus]|nr:Uncharacterized protein GBIM_00993 [Gryllus bimaculatus]